MTRIALVKALGRSSDGIAHLIELGDQSGGFVPRAVWQNFPTDLEHFLAYFAAHEAHHRGQLCLVARQLGARLPREVTGGLWQWTRFAREERRARARPGHGETEHPGPREVIPKGRTPEKPQQPLVDTRASQA